MFLEARVGWNTAKHYLLREYHDRSVGSVAEHRLDDALAAYDDRETVFVHAGLSAVKRAFGGNPYEFLLGKLEHHFDNVLVPGFTPSFRQSGIFHRLYSKPEFGTFARLFHCDAEYRTADAIHSILVRGDYRFERCDHQDSFGPDSCWAKLDADRVLYLNIGTDWLVSTQHHHIEHAADVPYLRRVEHEGIVYHEETTHEEVTQRNYEYDFPFPVKRGALGIQRDLVAEGVIEKHDMNGLLVLLFDARELREALEGKLERDPYYLIT